MKKLILLVIFLFTISINYSQNKETPEISKSNLIEFIEQAIKTDKISENPVVVLDEEIIIDLNGLNEDQKFYGSLSLIKKGNEQLTEVYGENAINGIIMIQSPPKNPEGQDIEISKSKVIFFIGDKEVSEKDLKSLHPDSIQNVQVIKTKEEILKYTDKECDGLVIINLKNQD